MPWLTYDDFADRVGEQFHVRLREDHSLTLVLSEATPSALPGGPDPEGASRQQFSLLFRGPSSPSLDQGTWDLSHDAMGELAVFLVPLGPDAQGPRYEAVFA